MSSDADRERAQLARVRAALELAEDALFDIYLHEGPLYGLGITESSGGTIREKINRFNLAIHALHGKKR